MTAKELETALGSMVVLVDTREQDTQQLHARLKAIERPVERCKLDYGDYSARLTVDGEPQTLPVAIERKMSFDELTACYCKGRKRFRAEFERAKAAGAKIYLLVENGSWEKAYAGRYRTQMQPKAFIASLLSWLARYDCQLIFCDPLTSGKLIHDILYRESREYLERKMLNE